MTTDYYTTTYHPCYDRDCEECRKSIQHSFQGRTYFCMYSLAEDMGKTLPVTEVFDALKDKLTHLNIAPTYEYSFVRRAVEGNEKKVRKRRPIP